MKLLSGACDFVKLGTAGWIVSRFLQSASGVGERYVLEFASPQREKSGRRFMASITQTTQLIPRHIGPGPKLCSIIRPQRGPIPTVYTDRPSIKLWERPGSV
ncbi:hypothetical protein AOLI_G00078670 [Acnodon oligacanthus]